MFGQNVIDLLMKRFQPVSQGGNESKALACPLPGSGCQSD
jgi:hypothetical protein